MVSKSACDKYELISPVGIDVFRQTSTITLFRDTLKTMAQLFKLDVKKFSQHDQKSRIRQSLAIHAEYLKYLLISCVVFSQLAYQNLGKVKRGVGVIAN